MDLSGSNNIDDRDTHDMPSAAADDLETGRDSRSHSWHRYLAITGYLAITVGLTIVVGLVIVWLLQKQQPKSIIVEQYDLRVLDMNDNGPVSNVNLAAANGSLIGRTKRDGRLHLADIDIVPSYKLVQPDYHIWQKQLPKDGIVKLQRLMATVRVNTNLPYSCLFKAYRFEFIETAEPGQQKEFQIPINVPVTAEFRIGPPSQWPHEQVMLNSTEDMLTISIRQQDASGTVKTFVDWQINHWSSQTQTYTPEVLKTSEIQ